MVLVRDQLYDKALPVLLAAIQRYPWNWSAWLALARCIKSMDQARFLTKHARVTFAA